MKNNLQKIEMEARKRELAGKAGRIKNAQGVIRKRKYEYMGEIQAEEPLTKNPIQLRVFGKTNEFVDVGFTKVFNAFTQELISDSDIAGKSIRLIFWIANNLEYNNIIFYMDSEEVAEELGVSKRTIFNWIKKLREKKILKKLNTNLYMINPKNIAVGQAHQLIEMWENAEDEAEAS